MPNRAALRSYVREQTLVENDDFSSTKMNAVMNQAIRETASRLPWPWLASSGTFTTIANQQNYGFPEDSNAVDRDEPGGTVTAALRLHSIVKVGENVRLREVSFTNALQRYGDDPPTGASARLYYLYGRQIYLLPVPSESSVVYRAFYYASPELMDDDTDIPQFATIFHIPVIAEYTIAKVWEREEDYVAAAAAMARFNEGVERMARFYLQENNDAPSVWGEYKDVFRSGNLPVLDGA